MDVGPSPLERSSNDTRKARMAKQSGLGSYKKINGPTFKRTPISRTHNVVFGSLLKKGPSILIQANQATDIDKQHVIIATNGPKRSEHDCSKGGTSFTDQLCDEPSVSVINMMNGAGASSIPIDQFESSLSLVPNTPGMTDDSGQLEV